MAGMRTVPWVIGLVVLGAALATHIGTSGSSAAVSSTLHGTVGPGFDISLTYDDGTPVASPPAGSYRIVVNDVTSDHNFHLIGPGTTPTPIPLILLSGSVNSSAAKLLFHGKRVSSLKAAKYRVTITDSAAKAGFKLQRLGLAAKSLTSAAFVGRHTVVLILAAGKWKYYSSAHPASALTFTVTAAK